MGAPPWRQRFEPFTAYIISALSLSLFFYGGVHGWVQAWIVALSIPVLFLAVLRLPSRRQRWSLLYIPLVVLAWVVLGWSSVSSEYLPQYRQAWQESASQYSLQAPLHWALEPIEGVRIALRLVIPISSLAVGVVIGRLPLARRQLWWAFVIGGAGVALIGLIHWTADMTSIWGRHPLVDPSSISAPFVNANHFASMMATLVPLTTGFGLAHLGGHLGEQNARRFLGVVGSIVVLFLILTVGTLANSRGFYLSTLCGLVAFFVAAIRSRRPNLGRAIVVITGIFVALLIYDSIGTGRVVQHLSSVTGEEDSIKGELWPTTRELFVEAPILGNGLGSFRPAWRHLQAPGTNLDAPWVENDALQLLAEMGLFGVALLVVALLATVRHLGTRQPRPIAQDECPWSRAAMIGASCALFSTALVDFFVHTTTGLILVGLLPGLGLGITGHRPPRAIRGFRQALVIAGVSVFGLSFTHIIGPMGITDESARIVAPLDYQLSFANDHLKELRSIPDDEEQLVQIIQLLEAAAKYAPASPEPHLGLAQTRMLQGDWEHAAVHARQASIHSPGDHRAHLIRARAYRNLGARELAMDSYTEAIPTLPLGMERPIHETLDYGCDLSKIIAELENNPCVGARTFVWVAGLRLSQSDRSRIAEAEAAKCPQKSVDDCMWHAIVARRSGAFDWSVHWARSCLEERRLPLAYGLHLGLSLVHTDPDEALQVFERVIAERDDHRAWIGKSEALKIMGRQDEAIRTLDQAFLLHPYEPTIIVAWARTHLAHGHNELVETELQALPTGVLEKEGVLEVLGEVERGATHFGNDNR